MCGHGNERYVRLCRPREASQRREVSVDACIAPLVQMLNDFGVHTTGCCCGHDDRTNGEIFYEQDGEQFEMKIWPGGALPHTIQKGAATEEHDEQPQLES